ncbi:MAG TPA: M3 family oligoendopeptidase [Verrucomicrobiae bacterium]|nr:M3 family oligoendopeptidase [Verrucomicrobiae bacterium]
MNLLPFGKLPAHKPRKFVPPTVDLGDWPQIAPLFGQLEQRAAQCKSAAELEHWLLDWSELTAALDEEASRRYIAMTCHTDNLDAEKAYLHFVEKVDPQLKPRQFALEKIYVAHTQREKLLNVGVQASACAPGDKLKLELQPRRYEVFDRDVRNHVELFRPENVPLETEEARLSQQYQKLSGSLTVNFRGEEKTLVQMARYLEEPDRRLRQEAWELVAKRRLQEADKFDGLLDAQIKLRQQIAHHAGFENYRDYAFRRLGRFDYTPGDCGKFHDAVEKEFMPVVRELQAQRRAQLKLEKLRPWDLAVDPLNRPPLKPFTDVGQMVSRTQKIFDRLDRELGGGFHRMQQLRLLDLDNRKGKAPGGYQDTLNEARLPFIFMNAVGLQRDVETILHEAGHAFHALATRDEDLRAYRNAPIEFCEVASMSMELLGNEFIEEFYPAGEVARASRPFEAMKEMKHTGETPVPLPSSDANRARRVHLEGIVGVFPWIATVDAFQHWIYTHPNHTRAERAAAWLELMDRFGGDVDWSEHEAARANLWHRQLHIFLHPFYYIEYGIAQLGALQVWANSKRDKAKALGDYKKALALGGSRPLPELFQAAGCKFEFSAKTIQPVAKMLREELEKL